MEENKIKEFRKKLQTLINSGNFGCWICGRDQTTDHHAIPQRIKSPLINITIPICTTCTEILHKNDELAAIIRRLFLR